MGDAVKKLLPRESYDLEIEAKLNDQNQWPTLEAYAVSYIKDRFYSGPVGWFTDIAMEKIYLRLCFNKDKTNNSRYAALKALYELWLRQEAQEAPYTIRVH